MCCAEARGSAGLRGGDARGGGGVLDGVGGGGEGAGGGRWLSSSVEVMG